MAWDKIEDLVEETKSRIANIVEENGLEKNDYVVYVFGSYGKGRFKKNKSDVDMDIAVSHDVCTDLALFNKIRDSLVELYHEINNPARLTGDKCTNKISMCLYDIEQLTDSSNDCAKFMSGRPLVEDGSKDYGRGMANKLTLSYILDGVTVLDGNKTVIEDLQGQKRDGHILSVCPFSESYELHYLNSRKIANGAYNNGAPDVDKHLLTKALESDLTSLEAVVTRKYPNKEFKPRIHNFEGFIGGQFINNSEIKAAMEYRDSDPTKEPKEEYKPDPDKLYSIFDFIHRQMRIEALKHNYNANLEKRKKIVQYIKETNIEDWFRKAGIGSTLKDMTRLQFARFHIEELIDVLKDKSVDGSKRAELIDGLNGYYDVFYSTDERTEMIHKMLKAKILTYARDDTASREKAKQVLEECITDLEYVNDIFNTIYNKKDGAPLDDKTDYAKYKELYPDLREDRLAELYEDLGNVYIQTHEKKLANEQFKKSIKSFPFSATAWSGFVETLDDTVLEESKEIYSMIYNALTQDKLESTISNFLKNTKCSDEAYKGLVEFNNEVVNYYLQKLRLESKTQKNVLLDLNRLYKRDSEPLNSVLTGKKLEDKEVSKNIKSLSCTCFLVLKEIDLYNKVIDCRLQLEQKLMAAKDDPFCLMSYQNSLKEYYRFKDIIDDERTKLQFERKELPNEFLEVKRGEERDYKKLLNAGLIGLAEKRFSRESKRIGDTKEKEKLEKEFQDMKTAVITQVSASLKKQADLKLNYKRHFGGGKDV